MGLGEENLLKEAVASRKGDSYAGPLLSLLFYWIGESGLIRLLNYTVGYLKAVREVY